MTSAHSQSAAANSGALMVATLPDSPSSTRGRRRGGGAAAAAGVGVGVGASCRCCCCPSCAAPVDPPSSVGCICLCIYIQPLFVSLPCVADVGFKLGVRKTICRGLSGQAVTNGRSCACCLVCAKCVHVQTWVRARRFLSQTSRGRRARRRMLPPRHRRTACTRRHPAPLLFVLASEAPTRCSCAMMWQASLPVKRIRPAFGALQQKRALGSAPAASSRRSAARARVQGRLPGGSAKSAISRRKYIACAPQARKCAKYEFNSRSSRTQRRLFLSSKGLLLSLCSPSSAYSCSEETRKRPRRRLPRVPRQARSYLIIRR